MEKTICELFAGVGGFRLGFDRLNSGWETVWFSQWEPGAKTQWAHECYVKHYGDSPDINGEYHTCVDIAEVVKETIPDHTLLVGGFPCQDYSVAHTLASSHGIEGKKGVLWWQIRDTIIAKQPPFCLLENVDRLLKSPAKQRGRDFGMILACLNELGYSAEWRVINAATYGAAQRRRRTFIFAYKKDTAFAASQGNYQPEDIILAEGLMAKAFPVSMITSRKDAELPKDLIEVSDRFSFDFRQAGYMTDGKVSTFDVEEVAEEPILLGQILEKCTDESRYITSDEKMAKWVYMKGAKKIPRIAANGHEYIFSEGPIAFPDPWDKPGRTMLTSESTMNRSTHIVSDPGTGRLRLLTPVEAERLQGFDDNWTDTGMPMRMRFFCMGNALVVPMITRMGKILDSIIDNEPKNEKKTRFLNNNEHEYSKDDLNQRFDRVLNRTLGEIDTLGILSHAQDYDLQKGIAGTIVEQCILQYPPDREQKPDLIIIDGNKRIPTELKTTGMRISNVGKQHYVAKEPMSITAVGVYDIADQSFYDSHFWAKIQHLLLVYYLYEAENPVPPSEYASFPIKGYEYWDCKEEDEATLRTDWNYVHDLCAQIVENHPGPRDKQWREAIKQEYIEKHRALRQVLSYVELVPKFPPRFRLKKGIVNSIISNHFQHNLEQLPGLYITVSDVDKKCRELEIRYSGLSIGEMADIFGVSKTTKEGRENKGIAEQIVVRMFGGHSHKLNNVDLFERFGLTAKTITMTPSGGRTEDMKLYHIDFEEMAKTDYVDEDGSVRPFEFEDSEMYNYFSSNEFLCIVFEEPAKEYRYDYSTKQRKEVKHLLVENTFVGFKRVVFSDSFIEEKVRKCWEDTRDKILKKQLIDVIQKNKDGSVRYVGSGDVSSAPNFMKSSENTVFLRGSGEDSSLENKTEMVNGIRMLPQYLWIKGTAIVEEVGLMATEYPKDTSYLIAAEDMPSYNNVKNPNSGNQ